ncbi:hypothetical protein DRP04_06140 [Archaeoglobales archaeon]|nr:MAG: hypothetical protein DRP04_06140 [Archaeoglobales archaeon]
MSLQVAKTKKAGKANVAAISMFFLDKPPEEIEPEDIGFFCARGTAYVFLALETARRYFRDGEEKEARRWLAEAALNAKLVAGFCGLELMEGASRVMEKGIDKEKVDDVIEEAFDHMIENFE